MKDDFNIHNRPNRSYELVEYSQSWPLFYNDLASKLIPIFGDNLVCIEHVGSTSVPGLVAKPTVDISVAVRDLGIVKNSYNQLIQLGFKPLGDFIKRAEPEEYFVLNGQRDDDRLANVHVMQTGNSEIAQMILLRDYLREHPTDVEAYTGHKKALMSEYSAGDYNSYSTQKRDFVEGIKAKARNWNHDQLPK